MMLLILTRSKSAILCGRYSSIPNSCMGEKKKKREMETETDPPPYAAACRSPSSLLPPSKS